MAWQNPKTDWVVNPKNPTAEDFNRIEGNIDFLKGDIETKKGAIVNALNTVGLASSLEDTHATLASRITESNQGTKIITPSTVNQTIAKGFHSGQGYVKGDANLKAANIKKGVNIFGVSGSFDKVYTASEASVLAALGLPAAPIQGPTLSGRFLTYTPNSWDITAPSNKIWVIGDEIITETRTASVSIGTELRVLEIDIPGRYYLATPTSSTVSFGTGNSGLIIDVTPYSDYDPHVKPGSGDYGRAYLEKGKQFPPVPVISDDVVSRGRYTIAEGNWGITSKNYSLDPGVSYTVGTVPSSEQWLLLPGFAAATYANEKIYINGNACYSFHGCKIIPPGATLGVGNESTTKTARVFINILKLKAS